MASFGSKVERADNKIQTKGKRNFYPIAMIVKLCQNVKTI